MSRVSRPLLVLLITMGVGWRALVWGAPRVGAAATMMHHPGTASMDQVAAAMATLLAAGAGLGLCWCVVVAGIEAALAGGSGGQLRWGSAPTASVVRRLVFALCGLSLIGPPITSVASVATQQPSAAAPSTTSASTTWREHESRRHQDCPPACSGRLDGLQLPDLPVGRHSPASGDRMPPGRYVVVPGDCLWTIATDQLRPAATDAAVAARARALYSANRAVIGADPDLIFPGTALLAPEAHDD